MERWPGVLASGSVRRGHGGKDTGGCWKRNWGGWWGKNGRSLREWKQVLRFAQNDTEEGKGKGKGEGKARTRTRQLQRRNTGLSAARHDEAMTLGRDDSLGR